MDSKEYTWLALLRGVNVGGGNVVRMADLRSHLDADGFAGVRTYIQSGNVIWNSACGDADAETARITDSVGNMLGKPVSAVLLRPRSLETIIASAPQRFLEDKRTLRCDVMYLMPGLDPAALAEGLPCRNGVDEVTAGPGVVYFSRTIDGAGKSRLSRLASLPVYQQMTIRNWSTTRKLGSLLDATTT